MSHLPVVVKIQSVNLVGEETSTQRTGAPNLTCVKREIQALDLMLAELRSLAGAAIMNGGMMKTEINHKDIDVGCAKVRESSRFEIRIHYFMREEER